ncbi:hypothetical protein MTO96_002243 [Rhipicephalus appendiculatus]
MVITMFLIFQGFANDKWGPYSNQGQIQQNYKFKIWSGSHVLLSFHMSTEEAETFYEPPGYLYTDLAEQPPGSTMVAWLSLEDVNAELTYRCKDQQSTPNTRPFVQSVAAQNDDTEERSHLQTFPPVAVLKDMFFDILTRSTGIGGGNSADLWTLGNLYLRSGGWYEVCRQLLNNVNHFELWLYIKVGEKLR